jgi:hypothetical protein
MYQRDRTPRYIAAIRPPSAAQPARLADGAAAAGRLCNTRAVTSRGRIDYRMAKRALVRQVTRGAVHVQDVVDAHPELMRAARNVGAQTARTCPICRLADDRADIPIDAETTLREVTYVYGEALRQRTGRVVWTRAELDELAATVSSFTAYVVECCLVCGWNHLVSSELFGTDHLPGRALRDRVDGAGA